MKILLLGSGGREHAIAWKLKQSERCSELYIAPGNAGTSETGTNLPFSATDFKSISGFCISSKIDMLIIGPEDPLVLGIVDHLRSIPELHELMIIGPSKHAAQLEGSKAFAKSFMVANNIPTAAYREFSKKNLDEGIAYVKKQHLPVVLKADGLAAGKGVLICQDHEEAERELTEMIGHEKFGAASSKVVVEEFLDGIELSVFVLTDGNDYVLLPEAKDYKRIGERDKGLNTGGMGAISPVPFADAAFMKKVKEKIIEPTIRGLKKENFDYKGFVFFGLIKVQDEPYVIEYNCRMGDPETEVVIPRIKNDLVDLLVATAQGKLNEVKIETDKRFAATIMAVSGGYPGEYRKGIEIKGLENAQGHDSILFHAGTKKEISILSAGGRVLCVTSLADDLQTAVMHSKQALEKISFEGMYYRRDIGFEFFTPPHSGNKTN
jgi:phosphoribosylamine---glycine ligase